MFDFSFAELLVCFVVALVVLGPEKLPGIARALGRWTGQARVYLRNLTSELERETQAGEFRKQVDEVRQAFQEPAQAVQDAARKLADTASSASSPAAGTQGGGPPKP